MIEYDGRHLYEWIPGRTLRYLGAVGEAECPGCGGEIIYDNDSLFDMKVKMVTMEIYPGGCADCLFGPGKGSDPIVVHSRFTLRK